MESLLLAGRRQIRGEKVQMVKNVERRSRGIGLNSKDSAQTILASKDKNRAWVIPVTRDLLNSCV